MRNRKHKAVDEIIYLVAGFWRLVQIGIDINALQSHRKVIFIFHKLGVTAVGGIFKFQFISRGIVLRKDSLLDFMDRGIYG